MVKIMMCEVDEVRSTSIRDERLNRVKVHGLGEFITKHTQTNTHITMLELDGPSSHFKDVGHTEGL